MALNTMWTILIIFLSLVITSTILYVIWDRYYIRKARLAREVADEARKDGSLPRLWHPDHWINLSSQHQKLDASKESNSSTQNKGGKEFSTTTHANVDGSRKDIRTKEESPYNHLPRLDHPAPIRVADLKKIDLTFSRDNLPNTRFLMKDRVRQSAVLLKKSIPGLTTVKLDSN
ncbi:hypothetical protein M501DRAFT_1013120 [Patellaria atrata CBS 101060]|uniref:Uncharacterized protein n=1 Tax=Patellaria atrata CBS 101060 TaxID=1346257 RepID=A0A9P4SIW8_9PEZI|nr:hypothetical protein M501DRAFT_1013120 [Patellaria atrata CBS 101060]